jgi:hypothetical protein
VAPAIGKNICHRRLLLPHSFSLGFEGNGHILMVSLAEQ